MLEEAEIVARGVVKPVDGHGTQYRRVACTPQRRNPLRECHAFVPCEWVVAGRRGPSHIRP